MSPLVRNRLAKALDEGGKHFVEVQAPDLQAAAEALPEGDPVRARLLDVCAKVIPSTSGKRRDEQPTPRVWLGVSDLEHLLAERGGG